MPVIRGLRFTDKSEKSLVLQAVSEEKKRKRKRRKEYCCSCCGDRPIFCWTCPCGFQICNRCMEDNLWGLTCSGVNWQCPDCGSLRPY